MNQSNQIPWPRISAEAAVIIASILFAFAIDAWWDGVKTDRNTQEILDAVLVEMESNLTGLQDSITHHEEIVAAISTAQEQVSVAGLLETAVIDVEVFELLTGALVTLIATGMLTAIDEPALQISLGGFNRLASDLNERESRAVEFRDAARRRLAAIGDPIWNREDFNGIETDIHMLNLLTMRRAEEYAAIESARRPEEHLRVLIRQLSPDS